MIDEEKFWDLIRNWEYQTRYEQSARIKLTHPTMSEIIVQGHEAVPLLLKALPENWYMAYALYQITGDWPVKDEYAGNEEKIIECWQKWAHKHGYLK